MRKCTLSLHYPTIVLIASLFVCQTAAIASDDPIKKLLVETPATSITTDAAASTTNWSEAAFWQMQDGRPVDDSWQFVDGEVRLLKPQGGNGSLLSPILPSHFDLSFQWKIGAKTNSGLKYRVRQFDGKWLGLEYQIMDEPSPLESPNVGSTASIYELEAPSLNKPLNPVGQWNEARIVAVGPRLEHYLNGQLVATATIGGPNWEAKMARSKFYGRDGFGVATDGDRIMLTDHGGEIAFKNFKFTVLAAPPASSTQTISPQLANGMRNSWADQNSIVLWTRTTRNAEMVVDGPQFETLSSEDVSRLSKSTNEQELLNSQLPPGKILDQMEGACPGAPGEVRLTYFPESNRKSSLSTDWKVTHAGEDYSVQWKLEGLKPGTKYATIVETRPIGSQELTAVRRGGFQTAPALDAIVDLKFCMTTCHDYIRRDDGMKGHKIYPAMSAIDPNFVVHAGDIEYYDKPYPWSWTIELMRFRWSRIFALPHNREFYANRTTYFMKDDHDTLKNDCWAGQSYGAVNFEQGVKLFEEQFPSRAPRYSTVAWSKDVQIWLLEGRDYRSPNTMPDGPQKTILGHTQKAWLFETLRESKATFKLVFSPTPIVGPDRNNKKDNHANETFFHEGEELRRLFSELGNVIVFCGDRHWQYASVDSQTGLWEFGCGPGSEEHELGWKEGDVRPIHRFLRVQGGFLSGELQHVAPDNTPQLTLRHHSVGGDELSKFTFPTR